MALKIIIGDYKPCKDDIVISDFHPNVVKKKKVSFGGKRVLYAEFLSLNKKDIEFIMKSTTDDVVLVCETKKALHGVRKGRGVVLEYSEGYCAPNSPFDVALLIAKHKDREYVHSFLKYNKTQMYMVVKALISNFMYMCEHNKRVIAWLDEYLYKVNPEFLWAYAARNFKPENLRFLHWHYPKKQ